MLANWHSRCNTIKGTRVLTVDKVGHFSAVLAQKVLGGIPSVMFRMDLNRLQNLFRGVNYSLLFGVELYGVVDYLPISLGSGRIAKLLEKFPRVNAVSIKYNYVGLWLKLYRLKQWWTEIWRAVRCTRRGRVLKLEMRGYVSELQFLWGCCSGLIDVSAVLVFFGAENTIPRAGWYFHGSCGTWGQLASIPCGE